MEWIYRIEKCREECKVTGEQGARKKIKNEKGENTGSDKKNFKRGKRMVEVQGHSNEKEKERGVDFMGGVLVKMKEKIRDCINGMDIVCDFCVFDTKRFIGSLFFIKKMGESDKKSEKENP